MRATAATMAARRAAEAGSRTWSAAAWTRSSCPAQEKNTCAADITLTEADLATIDEILPNGGFGACYAEPSLPTWI
jgi:hypothetical protein